MGQPVKIKYGKRFNNTYSNINTNLAILDNNNNIKSEVNSEIERLNHSYLNNSQSRLNQISQQFYFNNPPIQENNYLSNQLDHFYQLYSNPNIQEQKFQMNCLKFQLNNFF